ncbi:MAG: tetraacyldisaccharide 4-kinase [Tenuifilum sp.]|jgi:tetraacyldisaccharide 4'-kinase|uniref:tetraacyldisaccharide 4'-kinase n=1 Tax=Tenuifilum sp. TaxID=2760880 RepID=UPI0024AC646F|nr:tetraacyldisaccharide 4'-kinase [Tenuifilum sp.]MDI3526623.1 tetraacyldisaccharide 4-kinase [Tenuifilum sp.]
MELFRLILLPFSWIYWLVVKVRHLLFDLNIFKSFQFDIPTICVGNLTVGGTGKTPHTDYLINLLKKEFRVGLLSRGYGRKTKGFRLVTITSKAKDVGDEPLQLKLKHPEVTCAVHEDRVNGVVELLRTSPDTDAIILDDAFQHRWIKAGLNILMIDYNRPVYNDFLLPAGNLRDSISEIKRANIVIVSKCPSNISPDQMNLIGSRLHLNKNQSLYFTSVRYGNPVPVFDSGEEFVFNLNSRVFALSGIANPKPFVNQLEKNYKIIGKKSFADHHNFSVNEILSIFEVTSNGAFVVTTEKDAARIRGLELPLEVKRKIYYLPLEVYFINNEENRFNTQIIEYVRENKPNRSFY